MKQISELSTRLNQHFDWNKAKMDCFASMLIGLLKIRSVNLAEIATAFPSNAQPESRYRRIQRFIHGTPIDYDGVALFVMSLFLFTHSDYYLTLDRTNWQWGKENINILVLAIVYQGQAIPIYWLLLDKKGNSNCRERIALMKRFIKHFGKSHIRGILADREFIGTAWFSWLHAEAIPFHIRIRKNAKVPNSHGDLVQAQLLFRFIKAGEKLVIDQARRLSDVPVYLSALRLEDGELLIVASSVNTIDGIETYALRWQIETLFGCLKERGFNLEDTRITDRRRIKRLLVVVVIAFCWAHRTGEWRHEQVKPIRVKKHQRLAKSIFKYGLDWIRERLLDTTLSLESFCHEFLQFIDFESLYPTV